jgi:hypothetical protein
MVKCSKAEVRRLKTALRWKIPAAQRQRIQMVLLRYHANEHAVFTFGRTGTPLLSARTSMTAEVPVPVLDHRTPTEQDFPARSNHSIQTETQRGDVALLGHFNRLPGQSLGLAIKKSLGCHCGSIARARTLACGIVGLPRPEPSSRSAPSLLSGCIFSVPASLNHSSALMRTAIRRTVRFLQRHEHGRGQAPSFGGVAETFVARNRGERVEAMDI